MMKYHTFWRRFWAGVVDGLVFLPIDFFDRYLSAADRAPHIVVAWAVFSYTAYWIYSVFLHARYGQTLGKMLASVKVLDASEERIPTFRQAFIRDIGYIVLNTLSLGYLMYLVFAGQYARDAQVTTLPGQMLGWASLSWFLLEIISMATNEKRRALHDYLAKTVVIRTDHKDEVRLATERTDARNDTRG